MNEMDPEMPELEDISENASSNHEDTRYGHEEERDLESSDEAKLPSRVINPPSYLDDYVKLKMKNN